MSYDNEAYELISNHRLTVRFAVSKVYRALNGAVEKEDLKAKAEELLCIFAGFIPDHHAYAGKLAEWEARANTQSQLVAFIQRGLNNALANYARDELRQRDGSLSLDLIPDDTPSSLGNTDDVDAELAWDELKTSCPTLYEVYRLDRKVHEIARRDGITDAAVRKRVERERKIAQRWYLDNEKSSEVA